MRKKRRPPIIRYEAAIFSHAGDAEVETTTQTRLPPRTQRGLFPPMSTLTEIEAAADRLAPEEKQELLLFLAVRLREERGSLPEPRKFTREEMEGWIAEDEADMRRLREVV
jgi:hypothetical protein